MKIVYRRCAGLDIPREKGGNFFDRVRPLSTARKLTRRLENIGFTVALQQKPMTPVPAAMAVPPEVCSKCNRWRLAKCLHHNLKPKRTNKKRSLESTV